MKKNVLVVSVHPDDETLGAGGTILRHVKEGDGVCLCVVTASPNGESAERQRMVLDSVAKAYPVEKVEWLKEPTTKLDTVGISVLVDKISAVVKSFRPEIVYLPFPGDTHHDHFFAFKAAWNCCKSFRYGFVKKVYCMETPSETDFSNNLETQPFVPNTYVDISDFLERKLEIMSIYKNEIGAHPFPRSLERLRAGALARGSQCGVKYAEAFMLLKDIQK